MSIYVCSQCIVLYSYIYLVDLKKKKENKKKSAEEIIEYDGLTIRIKIDIIVIKIINVKLICRTNNN